jgi:formate hydrogenlyase subunit 3/multisubunit Na+/H+ antiporter MnhD subunit
MDLDAIASDPALLATIGGHLLVLALAVLFTVLRRYSIGGFFAWIATLASLVLGVLWFLILGGGRGNSRADESVQLALDPQGGLGITVYIVVSLVCAYAMTWLCKRGRDRALQSSGPLPAS